MKSSATLTDNIKIEEGFRGSVYKDHLGFDTIGYGSKMPLSKEECSLILSLRLESFIYELNAAKPFILELDPVAQDVLYEMSYQLGVGGLLGFRKMWKHLDAGDYYSASLEMLDSKWAKLDTPERAYRLYNRMLSVSEYKNYKLQEK